MAGFEPQTDVQVAIIPIDAHMNVSVTEVEVCLLAVPTGSNFQIEMLSIGYRTNVLPIDGTAITLEVEVIDHSDGDSVDETFVAAYTLTGVTVLVNNVIWAGSKILDPGDVVNAEFATDGGISTASEGAALVVEYRVLRHS